MTGVENDHFYMMVGRKQGEDPPRPLASTVLVIPVVYSSLLSRYANALFSGACKYMFGQMEKDRANKPRIESNLPDKAHQSLPHFTKRNLPSNSRRLVRSSNTKCQLDALKY